MQEQNWTWVPTEIRKGVNTVHSVPDTALRLRMIEAAPFSDLSAAVVAIVCRRAVHSMFAPS
jgi:hypothetical protein